MRPLGHCVTLAALAAAAACHATPPATAVAPAAPRPDSMRAPAIADMSRRDPSAIPSPEVTSVAVSLFFFGDSLAPELVAPEGLADPARENSATASTPAPTWDIDVRSYETRRRVTYYVNRFQNEARPRFALWLQRGGGYEPMIRAKLCAAGLPEDLTYLALIESGYDPNAYSSAAAVGIWQLMTGTARGLGLRVDWWIDERRDPVRSTDAAIRFLSGLNGQFGSLYLAAAAYNGGPGRVARGLTRYADELEGYSGDDAYFALAETDYLRAETRDYVPKLIAAAIVAKDPARYGFTAPLDPPLAYDSVMLGPAIPLAAVASAAGVPLTSIVELNNQILRGMTPPSGRWWVRVPAGAAEAVDTMLGRLSPKDLTAFKRISVKTSSTIKTLSHKYDITSRQFVWFNPTFKFSKNKSGRVAAGRVVLIPTPATLAAARDVPDPAIERYGASRRRALTHVVKRGESLAGIAARYGTSVPSLLRLNGLKQSVIFPGQVILIVVRRSHPPKKPKQKASAPATR